MNPVYDVAAYYWPCHHADPRMEKLFGTGWTEWELIQAAKPKFPGHDNPRVPVWGHEDESDPAVIAKKIDAAAAHGVNAWIIDWYWYDNQPYLERMLNEGFLRAQNNTKIRWALMWANHTMGDVWPRDRPGNYGKLWDGEVDRKTFDTAIDHILAKGYLAHPSYWRVKGGLYFSIYEVATLIRGLGGLEATADALGSFRDKVRRAGLGELHLNAIHFQIPSLPPAVPGEPAITEQDTLDRLNFDSLTSYQWVHTQPIQGTYEEFAERAMAQWAEFQKTYRTPYFPHVTVGWDNNCRNAGELRPLLSHSTPTLFRKALVRAKALADTQPGERKIVTINSWNEWSEGSYLEPDTRFGMQYLEAVRDVFPPA